MMTSLFPCLVLQIEFEAKIHFVIGVFIELIIVKMDILFYYGYVTSICFEKENSISFSFDSYLRLIKNNNKYSYE